MKRNVLYVLAMATTLVACTDDYTDWAKPIANQQEEAKSTSMALTPAALIDYAALTGDNVQLFTAAVTAEGEYATSYDVQFSNGTVLKANGNGEVSVAELEKVLIDINGKRPVEHEYPISVAGYIALGDMTVKHTADLKITAKLYSPYVIEDTYYLVQQVGGVWDFANARELSHSGNDVYDDPQFTAYVAAPLKADESCDDWYFAIATKAVKESKDEAALMGVGADGDAALKGSLTEAGKVIKIPATAGTKHFGLSINMAERSYKVERLVFDELMYVPNNGQAWALATAPALQSADFKGVYTGFANLDGGFQLAETRVAGKGKTYVFADFKEVDDTVMKKDASGNLSVVAAGFYMMKADIPAQTIELTKTVWGIVGDAPGSWDEDKEMTYDAAKDAWVATVDMVKGSFKFRANKSWDVVNYGGSIDNLQAGAADLKVDEEGTYQVELYLTRSTSDKIYCTLTKQ